MPFNHKGVLFKGEVALKRPKGVPVNAIGGRCNGKGAPFSQQGDGFNEKGECLNDKDE